MDTPTCSSQPSTATNDAYLTSPASCRMEVPEPAQKQLSITSDGKTIDYIARASHVDVKSDTAKLLAKMFSLSYVAVDKDGNPDKTRPVTFCYNGGPGCASVPINFGGIGPRRVVPDKRNFLSANFEVEDNEHTLLKESDLVFLDAPGTGWSFVADGEDPSKLFGIDGDADAFARAIMSWLEANDRWSSPVFIFGESYGTIRNAVLMRILGERQLHVSGVVMLSSLFNLTQILPGDDLCYIGMLPTFAATAQHFGKAGQGVDEDEWFDQASEFAQTTYAQALMLGDALGDELLDDVAEKMSEFIGLSADLIKENHLCIDLELFESELLRSEGMFCGRLDTRYAGYAPHPAQREAGIIDFDPSDDAIDPAWVKAFRAFCSEELGYEGPTSYLANNYENVGLSWDWRHKAPGTGSKAGSPNVAFDIATALRQNPTLPVAFLGGRFDAATPFWNTFHDISCLHLPDAIKENLYWYRYGCGHMAYVDEKTWIAMDKDLHQFYSDALNR